ncbi:hypothetical protein XM53_13735 [Roseovarius atlanticus]|uniref:Uncharacterized protein n=1 Tax=Roseovarius atlanticus TaxID=1641875 RepID=A0A0T5NSK9_9RHOB|nr:hypothetical protein [Roseovarius atlanticus]KRS11776.1 hypothetical protein XM53_13735 [Roseovarius atlanticus]
MSTGYLFDPTPVHALPVEGEEAVCPIRRVFFVGRNHAAQVYCMGGATIPLPPETKQLPL